MYQCLSSRRATSAREEEEQEKTEPAMTRQALAEERLLNDAQEEEQPKAGDLDEKPEEEQMDCPRGSIFITTHVIGCCLIIVIHPCWQVVASSTLLGIPVKCKITSSVNTKKMY